ncbi:MAG: SIS domain-containing protein [Sphingomonas fennica]
MTTDPAGRPATLMAREAAEGGAAARRFLAANAETLGRIAGRLRARPPALVVTCARGSSDHAATYGKYLIETLLGVPVASAAPSTVSLFAARPDAPEALCIAISQSGRSPDLIETVTAYKASGAYTVAIVNDAASPLAALADAVLPLEAGPELSVAATKSYIASLVALAALVAGWTGDAALADAVATLPDRLERAAAADWGRATASLAEARNLFVIGRGYGLAVAQEAALKLKETCALHAEPFSSAEVRHGPMAIVERGFPILAFATSDAAGDDVRETAALFAERGAEVLLCDAADPAATLPSAAIPAAPLLEPILMIQAFYGMANALSLARGLDPDRPPHLRKVTQTR